ncbi:hypothetical protein [Listeria seeligeri]|uniref:hypothetical protein n=1 Tax=Listeria seeligeri TaxID=1640 RepID=UPI001C8C0FFB|nr:hypothetical protein [Listeria seeligeri]
MKKMVAKSPGTGVMPLGYKRFYSWKGIAVSVYEALTFAVVFATLVVMILDFNKPKK